VAQYSGPPAKTPWQTRGALNKRQETETTKEMNKQINGIDVLDNGGCTHTKRQGKKAQKLAKRGMSSMATNASRIGRAQISLLILSNVQGSYWKRHYFKLNQQSILKSERLIVSNEHSL